MLAYLTADRIGIATGGGLVTAKELQALSVLGKVLVIRPRVDGLPPFEQDLQMRSDVLDGIQLAHFYAGCFSATLAELKQRGAKTTATAAAHDVAESRRAHQEAGIPYDYPHLNDPELWKRYVAGYLAADVLICPSRHSERVMRGFGAQNRIEVIPHGCEIPAEAADFPARFTVGYLGSATAPDKDVKTLLRAWKKLAYPDAVLMIGGRDSQSQHFLAMAAAHGGGNIAPVGWVENVSDFYNNCSVYVQPSVTEGFGIEVVEALAHGRPAICSTGAGACDAVCDHGGGLLFRAGDADELADNIDFYRTRPALAKADGEQGRRIAAEHFAWDKIRARYVALWKELLG